MAKKNKAPADPNAPTPERKPRTPTSFVIQKQVGTVETPEWADFASPQSSVKVAKKSISEMNGGEGTYRIVRVAATIVAKPRTGLQLESVK